MPKTGFAEQHAYTGAAAQMGRRFHGASGVESQVDGEGEFGAHRVPRLLAAAPILAVSEELERQVGELRRVAPGSDATSALALYRDKLAAALQRARQIDLFVTTDVAATILGRSASDVTYLCRTGAIKAKKVGGVWMIDRLDLEQRRPPDARAIRAD